MQRHTIAVLVNDYPGVLMRVANLFGQRGFNIDSITVGASEEPGLSRMIITTGGDEQKIEQLMKQLSKLIDVISVTNLSENPFVSRELALIKVSATPSQLAELNGIVEPFRATIVDVGPTSLIVQVTGDTEKIDALLVLLQNYGVVELTRTGTLAMARSVVPATV
ncbi:MULTISPECIES: acetolactate synthase small subunit [Bacillales]|jgi:acetolactate synthase-1/3 small subunit|uniref:Acetolactate synthase small subunit n=1 Tax=Brevibacillus aydinogluensis TaxID=927786 RepID=A0AA48M985_9BACL|nr:MULTISPECIES: acetolactate synthase small subunit [Bacillales]REK63385.1 MAG: acetolactate synthase small subunit [Brevibacillus sp.]MBR8660114.1 acetolactate synthase small subunit [Brevibacillus sp. NL20B1]MDT3414195.1 acetolactate synthase-1/3 small subunit [Brevibacillus aydinogluensis]NNV03707.1 acetolactate synthase small subunit [Brevibacillus sp. MCWH]UFJ59803.1 acetolactate synthase small subunit [Anoxybacillus sediminis]